MKKALITGITGQDGHHLTKLLIEKDYEIYGFVNGQKNDKVEVFTNKFPQVKIIKGDLTDFSSIISAVDTSSPDEIYNLGALSFVGLSFSQPEITANVTGFGILRILEAVKKLDLAHKVRIYQASSSEMFGKVLETPQNEKTPFYPRSPYGVAKTFAHYTAVNYREAYNMHISCGILFNHEGEFRGHEFVTRKITSNVAKIKLGLQSKFSLGSLNPKRDWGYAGDYVDSMWRMVQQDKSDTFVIATGVNHSIREFLELALEKAELAIEPERYVDFDENLVRPSEVDILIGDYSKAKNVLKWQPKTTFEEMVEIMIQNDLNLEYKKSKK